MSGPKYAPPGQPFDYRAEAEAKGILEPKTAEQWEILREAVEATTGKPFEEVEQQMVEACWLSWLIGIGALTGVVSCLALIIFQGG